ncbi:MAG: hypothetical protein FJ291_10915 [Planctomycetes bacterium]|nr:hypothetical protein [Planctomycetota bacterium]
MEPNGRLPDGQEPQGGPPPLPQDGLPRKAANGAAREPTRPASGQGGIAETRLPPPIGGGWPPPCGSTWPRRPAPRSRGAGTALARLARRLARHNPAYLISAALMILGVYSIVQPGSQAIGNIPAILATFSTLQFYELLLVGIAVFLVCRRGVTDDGATLVLIEALFAVGCFVVADELAFKDRYRPLGLFLGLSATLLAAGRLAALGKAVGRSLPFSALGLLLAALLLWNGAAPAWVSSLHDADSPFIDAACLAGWWAIAALAFGLALLAAWERGPLRAPDTPFVRAPLARWAIAGIIVATTALHQYWIGYILDAPALASDALPLVTVLALGLLHLLRAERQPVSAWEHVAAAVPAALCLAALLLGGFEPLAQPTAPAAFRQAYLHELRTLTWPTAWLGVVAVMTALHAWRRRSAPLAHQAAAVLALAALFWRALSPADLRPDLDAFLLALAAWFAVAAAAERSPAWAAGALLAACAFILRQWPAKAVAGVYIDPRAGALALFGLACWALWLTFRDRVPRWVAHAGAILLVEAAIGLNFGHSVKAPGWLLAALTIGTAAGLAAMGHGFRWWAYYLLATGTLLLAPARSLTASKQTLGSPSGWLLVMGAFVALGLGFIVSLRKAGAAPPLPAPHTPDRRQLQ